MHCTYKYNFGSQLISRAVYASTAKCRRVSRATLLRYFRVLSRPSWRWTTKQWIFSWSPVCVMAASQHVLLVALAAFTILLVQLGHAQQVVRVRGRPRSRAKSFAPVPTVPLVNIFAYFYFCSHYFDAEYDLCNVLCSNVSIIIVFSNEYIYLVMGTPFLVLLTRHYIE